MGVFFALETEAAWNQKATNSAWKAKSRAPIRIPPPQMVARLRAGFIDGCCVGEPWNARAMQEEVGFTAATSQQIWPDHPEKVLSATSAFVERHPNSARALVMALLEACRYIDTTANRRQVADLIAGTSYIDTPVDIIAPRFLGD